MRIALTLIAALVAIPFAPAMAADERPNILIIFADDMGFSDIGCYGSEIETPNLDSLAENGLRFRQFYNTGRCCPSRASILTGLYSHQAGVGHMTGDYGHPSYQGYLNEECVTIGEALGEAGYQTNAIGKWHVGDRKPQWPLQRGFDRYFGTPSGGGFYFKEAMELRKRFLTLGNERLDPPGDWYITDIFTDYAIEFMEESIDAEKPFFTYLAHICPHWPIQAREEDIAKYEGKFTAGWDEHRRQRLAKQREMGLSLDSWTLSERDSVVSAWDSLSDNEKQEMDRRMAVYAAMIDVMDRNIGRIIEMLKAKGEFENTLILFLSDNGGCHENPMGHTRKATPGAVIGSPESYTAYFKPWANASNTPFRKYKQYTHEGGISSPLVAHWPKGFEARGEFTDQVAHIIDVMPTCLDVAGVDYPSGFDGQKRKPLEGASLVPALRGESFEREPLFWEHEGHRAVRIGDWKLVASHGNDWELYDLSQDRSETRDLSAKYPDRVAEITATYAAWTERCGVLPWPARESAKRLSQP
ncbi:arylsulfatase [Stratiformator vulcanicus]|uniref:Arylsulfatase n=1 Tax=Stratiformator vulcanicus TaxID=2527980 RepID=A0A517R7C3_9PLAN|nr:arylsulfatase [Stratiformator vulcanicus]QDT39794.1 Arylsulfatase [Stratiformator vulcanicus]